MARRGVCALRSGVYNSSLSVDVISAWRHALEAGDSERALSGRSAACCVVCIYVRRV